MMKVFALTCLLVVADAGFTYSKNVKHTSILKSDGCYANTVNDQIEYVKLTGNTATTLSATVGYKPVHSGSWTMSRGVSVQCWHFAAGSWDSSPVLSKQDAGIGYGYGYGKGPARTHSFTWSPRAGAGDHYLRCGIIDRSSSSCHFDAGNHCASRNAGKSSGHHYDNADVKFTFAVATPSPTNYPTPNPTNYPTPNPTNYPTPNPTNYPTPNPTNYPTPNPTNYPTPNPTSYPTPQCSVTCSWVDGHHIEVSHDRTLISHNKKTHGAHYAQHKCYHDGTTCHCECHGTTWTGHGDTSAHTKTTPSPTKNPTAPPTTSFTYSTAQHTTTLIGDGCLANSADDQIEYVQLTSNTATTLSGTVGYKPLHSGSWTMSNGVSVQCWHYADDRWDSSPILAKQDAGIGYGYGYGKGPSRTHAFIFTPRAATGTHYVRCGIIDRASATCNFDKNTHCGSNSAGSSTAHHYDNADVAFTM